MVELGDILHHEQHHGHPGHLNGDEGNFNYSLIIELLAAVTRDLALEGLAEGDFGQHAHVGVVDDVVLGPRRVRSQLVDYAVELFLYILALGGDFVDVGLIGGVAVLLGLPLREVNLRGLLRTHRPDFRVQAAYSLR